MLLEEGFPPGEDPVLAALSRYRQTAGIFPPPDSSISPTNTSEESFEHRQPSQEQGVAPLQWPATPQPLPDASPISSELGRQHLVVTETHQRLPTTQLSRQRKSYRTEVDRELEDHGECVGCGFLGFDSWVSDKEDHVGSAGISWVNWLFGKQPRASLGDGARVRESMQRDSSRQGKLQGGGNMVGANVEQEKDFTRHGMGFSAVTTGWQPDFHQAQVSSRAGSKVFPEVFASAGPDCLGSVPSHASEDDARGAGIEVDALPNFSSASAGCGLGRTGHARVSSGAAALATEMISAQPVGNVQRRQLLTSLRQRAAGRDELAAPLAVIPGQQTSRENAAWLSWMVWSDPLDVSHKQGVCARPLSEVLNGGCGGPEWQLSVAHQICAALAGLHQCGKCHGGLAPRNIWVSPGGDVGILETGLVGALMEAGMLHDNDLLACQLGIEFARYLSPECWEMPPRVGQAADIWSLGLVLLEVLGAKGLPHPECATLLQLCGKVLPPHLQSAPQVSHEGLFGRLPQETRCVVQACLDVSAGLRPSAQRVLACFGSESATPQVQKMVNNSSQRSDTLGTSTRCTDLTETSVPQNSHLGPLYPDLQLYQESEALQEPIDVRIGDANLYPETAASLVAAAAARSGAIPRPGNMTPPTISSSSMSGSSPKTEESRGRYPSISDEGAPQRTAPSWSGGQQDRGRQHCQPVHPDSTWVSSSATGDKGQATAVQRGFVESSQRGMPRDGFPHPSRSVSRGREPSGAANRSHSRDPSRGPGVRRLPGVRESRHQAPPPPPEARIEARRLPTLDCAVADGPTVRRHASAELSDPRPPSPQRPSEARMRSASVEPDLVRRPERRGPSSRPPDPPPPPPPPHSHSDSGLMGRRR